MLKKYSHTPAHLLLDGTPYFITGAIYKKRPLLRDTAMKERLHEILHTTFREYGWNLDHWVILDNHYHLLVRSKKGSDLPKMMQRIHAASSKYIGEATSCEKPVWYNYWDYCPRNEHEYYSRLNYLLNNPIKHGYVSNLHDYPHSSFHALFKEWGRERLVEQFRTYPATITLEEAEDDDF
jgi:putative transposase